MTARRDSRGRELSTRATLNAAIAQYLAAYVNVAGKKPGVVEAVSIASHTPSGRVGTLTVTTDRGNFVLRGNDIRFVLRKPGGEILESTYFSVATAPAPDGSLARLTLHGMGYGHGVGMCQWGAIGRARAGQDFRDDSPGLLSGHRDRAGAVASHWRGH